MKAGNWSRTWDKIRPSTSSMSCDVNVGGTWVTIATPPADVVNPRIDGIYLMTDKKRPDAVSVICYAGRASAAPVLGVPPEGGELLVSFVIPAGQTNLNACTPLDTELQDAQRKAEAWCEYASELRQGMRDLLEQFNKDSRALRQMAILDDASHPDPRLSGKAEGVNLAASKLYELVREMRKEVTW